MLGTQSSLALPQSSTQNPHIPLAIFKTLNPLSPKLHSCFRLPGAYPLGIPFLSGLKVWAEGWEGAPDIVWFWKLLPLSWKYIQALVLLQPPRLNLLTLLKLVSAFIGTSRTHCPRAEPTPMPNFLFSQGDEHEWFHLWPMWPWQVTRGPLL